MRFHRADEEGIYSVVLEVPECAHFPPNRRSREMLAPVLAATMATRYPTLSCARVSTPSLRGRKVLDLHPLRLRRASALMPAVQRAVVIVMGGGAGDGRAAQVP